MKRLVPYGVLAGDVSLEVSAARLDDVALPFTMISGSQRVIALHQVERSDWETARLAVQMRLPQQELAAGPWTGVTCMAVLSERRTNVRTTSPLRETSPGIWAGEVVLHRDRHLDRAELTSLVVGTVDGVVGRMIGAADESWLVDLQAQTPARHKSIRTVWADFGDDDHVYLHSFRSDPWTIEAVGEEPVLYLNRAFEGLAVLLKGSQGGHRAARDAIAAQIAADVWTALFNAALFAAGIENGVLEWPGGWRESTLRRMLPDVFNDLSPDEALGELVLRRQSGDGGGDLQTRVLHAATKQARLAHNLGGFMRTLRRVEEEER